MDNKKWRGVPIETLKKYLDQQPTITHRAVELDTQGNVLELSKVGDQPFEVIRQPEEN